MIAAEGMLLLVVFSALVAEGFKPHYEVSGWTMVALSAASIAQFLRIFA